MKNNGLYAWASWRISQFHTQFFFIMSNINSTSISVLAIVNIMIAVGLVSSFASIETTRPHRLSTSIGTTKRNEINDAIKAALTVSNKYGVASYKAVMAWKAVEEMDNATNLDKEAIINHYETDIMDKEIECIEEYDAMLNDLKSSLEKQELVNERIKSIASEIKTAKDVVGKNTTNSLHDAIVFARKASKKFGMNSTQSEIAWETFDKIASKNELQMKPMTEIECLLENIEKCMILEELQRGM
eukprot:CCRYP_019308-RA/>CCRYP_019308-RA protein AED:0.04 eAED:0.04 QI:62/1/1/1/1/1/2/155/243